MTGGSPVRRPSAGGLLLCLTTGLALPPLAAWARPSVEGPAPGHTGGFGEPTCSACHASPADGGDASVMMEGLPANWVPGERYALDIVLRAPELERGGFQLAARFSDGDAAGSQAGTLAIDAPHGRVTTDTTGIQYAHHIYKGSTAAEGGVLRWTVAWTAPDAGHGSIAFHVAANASNDDNSELGDRIVVSSDTVPEPGSAMSARR